MAESTTAAAPPVAQKETKVRFALPSDLEFLRQDGDLSSEIIQRKIDWREILIAERGGDLVGYVRVEYLWAKVPYLSLIHVFPKYRRQGIGETMLRFMENLYRGQNHETLYCSLQADESSPLAWLRRMGFEECGIIAGINPGGIGEVFFRKRLRPSATAAPLPDLPDKPYLEGTK